MSTILSVPTASTTTTALLRPDDDKSLSAFEAIIIGLGAIGGVLATFLAELGVGRFVLADPKKHKLENTRSQCLPNEVGQWKVRATAAKLRRGGASRVVAWPKFIEEVEPGWAGPDSFVIVCGDRLSAVRAAHDLARLLRRPLFRLNIEPAFSLATLSCFDYRADVMDCCALCGWGEREFSAQENVYSCAPSAERPTGSPRRLSVLAASWGASVISRVLRSPGTSDWGTLRSFYAEAPKLVHSELPRRPDCAGGHANPVLPDRLEQEPRELSFQSLAEHAGFKDSDVRVTGSAQVALRGRCDACGRDKSGCWWVRGRRLLGRCCCGGALFPVPFFTMRCFEPAEIGEHWVEPLATLGVHRREVITLTDGNRSAAVVVG